MPEVDISKPLHIILSRILIIIYNCYLDTYEPSKKF